MQVVDVAPARRLIEAIMPRDRRDPRVQAREQHVDRVQLVEQGQAAAREEDEVLHLCPCEHS